MNKKYIYPFLFLLLLLAGCNPIEDRDSIGSAITADQLDISATPVVVNGQNSNKVVLKNHSAVLSYWNYGSGVSRKSVDTALLVITSPEYSIVFTGRNPDGSTVEKELFVNIESLAYPVSDKYGYLLGRGEKTWTWDADKGYVWGMGAYGMIFPYGMGEKTVDELGVEGRNATMTFAVSGAYVKTKNDNIKEEGTAVLDPDAGTLTFTGATLLNGVNAYGGAVYEYEIVTLTDTEMVLGYYVTYNEYMGDVYCYWLFKAVE
jgi:hypothetical protein